MIMQLEVYPLSNNHDYHYSCRFSFFACFTLLCSFLCHRVLAMASPDLQPSDYGCLHDDLPGYSISANQSINQALGDPNLKRLLQSAAAWKLRGNVHGSCHSIHVSKRQKHPQRRALHMCGSSDISISQGLDGSHGMPQFVVQIVNTCLSTSGCTPTDIHLYCGWFASAPLVNPNVFRRIAYDDCLVNAGRPLRYGDIIRFQYANSFMYPLRLRSVKFC